MKFNSKNIIFNPNSLKAKNSIGKRVHFGKTFKECEMRALLDKKTFILDKISPQEKYPFTVASDIHPDLIREVSFILPVK